MRLGFRRFGMRAAGIVALAACGCGGSPAAAPTPAPPPTPTPGTLPGVMIGARTGTTQITLSDATPRPGVTLTGCGATAIGCAGRISMSLDLWSPTGGPVTGLNLFLHGTNLQACLIGRVGFFELSPGTKRRVDVVLDQADSCGTPVEIRTADASVEGPNGIAARQEWGISYSLAR